MGVVAFDVWAAEKGVAKSFDLKFLQDRVIGIDAAYYIHGLNKDPLLSALGGPPLAFESTVIHAVKHLQNAGLKLHFVFNGLESGVGSDPFTSSARAARFDSEAFTLYEAEQAKEARDLFKASGHWYPSALSEILKKTLHEQRIPFTVAPYSALAQLVYYEKHPSQFIDAVYGPSELFCFGIDKLITKFQMADDIQNMGEKNIPESPVLELSTFQWIDRRDCLAALNTNVNVFIDALMLAGSGLLPTFPPLENENVYRKPFNMRNVVEMITSCGGSVVRLCAQYSTDPAVKGVYLDQYKRALTRIRYHVIMTDEGEVEILDKSHAPDDAHECIGLRLPEELYMYLSRGMLRPRVLNWLTSGKISITQPLAGGDGRPYQNLVKVQLDPLRRQALSLLTEPIHRYYHSRDITTSLWFDPSYDGKFNMRDISSPRDLLSKWNVKNNLIAGYSTEDLPAGTLSFAILSLENPEFAAKTVTQKPKAGQEPLKHRDEILANAVWRLLQLRGYLNEQHQLTEWGRVLEAVWSASGTRRDEEEAALIAVELMRFELINPDTMFLGYGGAPGNGSDIDKRNAMLVSRVACLGKIRHSAKGYSGPLSRHMLAYHSIVSSVHASLRDLLEMIVAAMFLEGLVDRDREDWADISLGLPFYQEQSCALGVLTMHFLDDLCNYPNPTSESTRAEVKRKGQEWIMHGDFSGSLDDAFRIWDAVYQGVKAAGNMLKDTSIWDEVDTWLSQRK